MTEVCKIDDKNNIDLSKEESLKQAKCYAENDKYDEAIEIVERLVKNDSENEEYKYLLANYYYSKGIRFCYSDENGNVYNISEENTLKMIECMKKANEYVYIPDADKKIKWGLKSLQKTFDKKNKFLFLIPLLIIIFAKGWLLKCAGIAIAAVLLHFSMKPLWKINRNKMSFK